MNKKPIELKMRNNYATASQSVNICFDIFQLQYIYIQYIYNIYIALSMKHRVMTRCLR